MDMIRKDIHVAHLSHCKNDRGMPISVYGLYTKCNVPKRYDMRIGRRISGHHVVANGQQCNVPKRYDTRIGRCISGHHVVANGQHSGGPYQWPADEYCGHCEYLYSPAFFHSFNMCCLSLQCSWLILLVIIFVNHLIQPRANQDAGSYVLELASANLSQLFILLNLLPNIGLPWEPSLKLLPSVHKPQSCSWSCGLPKSSKSKWHSSRILCIAP